MGHGTERHGSSSIRAQLEHIDQAEAVEIRALGIINRNVIKIGEIVMANIDQVLARVSAIEGDTANVERVLGDLNTQITGLRQQVADLQAKIDSGAGVTSADLQGVDDRLAAADATLDSLAPDA